MSEEIINVSKQILDRLYKGQGFSNMELQYNEILKKFIRLIANEQKSSYIMGDEETWDSVLLIPGENDLVTKDVEQIISQLLSNNPYISDQQLFRILTNKHSYRLGWWQTLTLEKVSDLGISIKREATDNGAITFGYSFPMHEYVKNDLLNRNSPLSKQLMKKVLIPYHKYLERKRNEVTNSRDGVKIPEVVTEDLLKIITTSCKERGLEPQKVANYVLNYVLGLRSVCSQRRILRSTSESTIMTLSKNKALKDLFYDMGADGIKMMDSELDDQLTTLLSGVSSQLYMNSVDISNKSSQQIQEILKTGYKIYTKGKENDNTYRVDADGYRTIDVALGNADILLHKRGNNIKVAMDNLCQSMKELVENKDNLTDEEYIRSVAILHFRYISIHPFRDANGRSGRNIINMLLAQKGEFFSMDKADRDFYLRAMNGMRSSIDLPQYLFSLSEEPEKLSALEEPVCQELAKFFEQHIHRYTNTHETFEDNGRGTSNETKAKETEGH